MQSILAESHQKMLSRLAEVEKETQSNNIFLSDVGIKELKQRVVESRALKNDPHTYSDALRDLGILELKCGFERDAIRHFLEVKEIVIKQQDHNRLMNVNFQLAVAWLRVAENENCCAKPGPESCIFPLKGGAIHGAPEGSQEAMEILSWLEKQATPNKMEQADAHWLLNIAQMTLGKPLAELPEHIRLPDPEKSLPKGKFPVFKNVSHAAGVDSFGLSGGAVADDFDGDGLFDLVVSSWETSVSLKFFRNRGDGTFENTSKQANFEGIKGGLNLKQVDFDNDGDLDIYVMRGAWMGSFGQHQNSLLQNDGHARFTDVTFAVGLGESAFPNQTAGWADFDLDGDLDLFVGNETFGGFKSPSELYRNDGPDSRGVWKFTEIASEAKLKRFAYFKGVSWGDFNEDGFPDLYVSCLGEKNHLYQNRGDGTFGEVTTQMKVEKPIWSFPAWFWDFDSDGHLDLFASAYSGVGAEVFLHSKGMRTPDTSIPRLYRNNGKGGFDEVARKSGFDFPMLPMGSNFGDLTNDGFPDCYLGTGSPEISSIVPSQLISNENGHFVDRTVQSRTGHLQKGHAVAIADFDRDGDLDIFEQMGGAYTGDPYYDVLYENPGGGGHWISVRLRGVESNSFGVGSRVGVLVKKPDGSERWFYRWMNSGGSFGANPLELHMGLADAELIQRIEVRWQKTGKTQTVKGLKMNQRIVIKEKG